jgi:hypothetical protein
MRRMSGWGPAGVLASALLLAIAAPGYAPARAQAVRDGPLPCRAGFTTIRMTPLASGHHSVSVMLNGKPGAFLVDTGAGATVIHSPYLHHFALTAAAAGTGGNANGKIRLDAVRVSAFAVGGARTRLHQMYAMDLSYIVDAVSAESARPIEGLIGQDVLRDQKAMIDFDRSVLYLANSDSAGKVCGPAKDQIIALPARPARRAVS